MEGREKGKGREGEKEEVLSKTEYYSLMQGHVVCEVEREGKPQKARKHRANNTTYVYVPSSLETFIHVSAVLSCSIS